MRCSVQVQDSGTGFDPQQAEHIFEPFFTTKPEGIGMGLSISRSIVESHGGQLWAESGSHRRAFSIYFAAYGAWCFMTEAPPIVFVVDDDPSVGRAIKRLVESVGLQVAQFGSAQEFLAANVRTLASCLVLDVRLPGISGLDFQRQLADANITYSNHLRHCPWRHPDDRAGHEGGGGRVSHQAVSRPGSAGCRSGRVGAGPRQTPKGSGNCDAAGIATSRFRHESAR